MFVNREMRIVIVTYVNKSLVPLQDVEAVAHVKEGFARQFKMSDFDPAGHYLGIRVTRKETSLDTEIKLSHKASAEKMLKAFNVDWSNLASTPMDEKVVLELYN